MAVERPAGGRRTLEEASRTSAINIDFRHEVWGCRCIPALQPDTLVSCLLGFDGSIDTPIVLDLDNEDYEILPEIGTAFRPDADNRNLFTRRGGRLRKHQHLRELINQIDATSHTVNLYGISLPEVSQLASGKQYALTDIST